MRRPICPQCQRPQSTCICHWVTPVDNQTEVLILQHPLEVSHAKNTARLLHMSLAHSQLLIGETFGPLSLSAALAEPKYTMLLYPPTETDTAQEPDPAQLIDPGKVRLLILDGTWRKSRKMLHVSPLLQALPRLSLSELPSGYTIRKAQKTGQLSTLEATCAALAQLECDAGKYQSLLKAFDGFVSQQQELIRENSH